MKPKHDSMRGWFFAALHEEMSKDDRIWLITADLGYGALDSIRDDFPNRFINAGASEQAVVGISVGLALLGKIPFVYSITPFLLYRPFEWHRNYLNHERIAVKLVGTGLDRDYEKDGITHHAEDAKQVLACLPNIKCFWPATKEECPAALQAMLTNGQPSFIALRR